MQPVFNYIKHPARLMDSLVKAFGQWLPDSTYLNLRYKFIMGTSLNLKTPQTFNEKLQWLKLYDRNPEYTKMVDKVEVKSYIASIIGEEYVIPLLGVWDKPEIIEWDLLPNSFVLKTTNGGGNTGVVVCRDKSKIDKQEVIKKLNYGLKQDIYKARREWPYKNVSHRIFAEKYINPMPNTNDLYDYKFFCFNGRVKLFKIDFNRQVDHHANYYDCDGNLLPFGEKDCLPQPEKEIEIPSNFKKMIELAELLSKNKHFLRVDFYDVNGHIYFGEMTFYPASGMGKFEPEEWDLQLGELLQLPRNTYE